MSLEAMALENRNDRHRNKDCGCTRHAGMDGEAMGIAGRRTIRRVCMWYVMQVISGQENRSVLLVKEMVSEGKIESCFVPMRRLRKKFHGEWHEVKEKLFPGYVFLVTEQPQLLYEELKRIPVLTKMLGRYGEYFTPLSEADVRTLKKLQNRYGEKGNLEVEISEIVVEDGKRIRILSGPLRNLCGKIKKINLHKRIAAVEMEFMGNKRIIYLGIEMLEKKGEPISVH